MTYKGKSKNKSKLYASEEGYDLYADRYDKDHDYLNTFENDVVLKMLTNLEGKKVLDIGCGTGRLIEFMRNRGGKIVAADTSSQMLKIVKKRFSDVETVHTDIEKMPFPDETFDVVIATFVIVHLDFLFEAFEEVYRVLKDGGIFIVTNVNQRKAPKLTLKNGEEIVIKSKYHRPEDVVKELEKNLFHIEKDELVYADGFWINQVVKARK